MREIGMQIGLSQSPKAVKLLLALLLCALSLVAVALLGLGRATRSSSTPLTAPVTQSQPDSSKLPDIAPITETPPTTQSADTSVEIHSSQTSPTQPPHTDVSINGQPVVTPDTGSSHTVISDDNSTTTLDTHSSSTTSNGHSSSSTNIHVNTDSRSSSSTNIDSSP